MKLSRGTRALCLSGLMLVVAMLFAASLGAVMSECCGDGGVWSISDGSGGYVDVYLNPDGTPCLTVHWNGQG